MSTILTSFLYRRKIRHRLPAQGKQLVSSTVRFNAKQPGAVGNHYFDANRKKAAIVGKVLDGL